MIQYISVCANLNQTFYYFILNFFAGVNKLGLLALVEQKGEDGVKENHESLSKLAKECGLQDIPHDQMSWTGDQKAINDFAGIGNHNSKYPCPYCKARLPFDGEEEAVLRTLGDLDDQHDGFVEKGSNLKYAMNFESCIHKRIIHGPREKKVIECAPPPTLHYKLRSVNYILDECARRTVKVTGRDIVKEFAIEKGIVKKNYHKGEFEVRMFHI